MRWILQPSIDEYKNIPYYVHTYELRSSNGYDYALDKLEENIPPIGYEHNTCPDEYASASLILSRLRGINKFLNQELEKKSYNISLEELKYMCNHRKYIKKFFDTENLLSESFHNWYEEQEKRSEKKEVSLDDLMYFSYKLDRVQKYMSALSNEVDDFEKLFSKCIEV